MSKRKSSTKDTDENSINSKKKNHEEDSDTNDVSMMDVVTVATPEKEVIRSSTREQLLPNKRILRSAKKKKRSDDVVIHEEEEEKDKGAEIKSSTSHTASDDGVEVASKDTDTSRPVKRPRQQPQQHQEEEEEEIISTSAQRQYQQGSQQPISIVNNIHETTTTTTSTADCNGTMATAVKGIGRVTLRLPHEHQQQLLEEMTTVISTTKQQQRPQQQQQQRNKLMHLNLTTASTTTTTQISTINDTNSKQQQQQQHERVSTVSFASPNAAATLTTPTASAAASTVGVTRHPLPIPSPFQRLARSAAQLYATPLRPAVVAVLEEQQTTEVVGTATTTSAQRYRLLAQGIITPELLPTPTNRRMYYAIFAAAIIVTLMGTTTTRIFLNKRQQRVISTTLETVDNFTSSTTAVTTNLDDIKAPMEQMGKGFAEGEEKDIPDETTLIEVEIQEGKTEEISEEHDMGAEIVVVETEKEENVDVVLQDETHEGDEDRMDTAAAENVVEIPDETISPPTLEQVDLGTEQEEVIKDEGIGLIESSCEEPGHMVDSTEEKVEEETRRDDATTAAAQVDEQQEEEGSTVVSVNATSAEQTLPDLSIQIDFYKKQYEKVSEEVQSIQQLISAKSHEIDEWEGALRMAEEAIARLNSSSSQEDLLQARLTLERLIAVSPIPVVQMVTVNDIALPPTMLPQCTSSLEDTNAAADEYLTHEDFVDFQSKMTHWAQSHAKNLTSLDHIQTFITKNIQKVIELFKRKTSHPQFSQEEERAIDQRNKSPKSLSRKEAQTIIEKQLRKQAADRTGEIDYAAIRQGGSVIHSKTSPSYADNLPLFDRFLHLLGLRFYGHPPEIALSVTFPPNSLGQCWAFCTTPSSPLPPVDETAAPAEDDGKLASLAVKLAKPVKVKSVVIEHPLKSVASNPSSAIRNFRIYGYESADAASFSLFLGEFSYDIGSPRSLQEFFIPADIAKNLPKIQSVKLAIDSNWGHSYSCLYRFRVHGEHIE